MQLHYKTKLRVQKSNYSASDKNIYQLIVFQVGLWLVQHDKLNVTEEDIIKTWFFKGGKREFGRSSIETVTFEYSEKDRNANYWAMRYDHNDNEYNSRFWRTDIAVYFDSPESAELIVSVSWYLNHRFIGKEPPKPVISSPKVVSYFLTNNELRVFADELDLSEKAKKLEVGDGKLLYQRILDSERELPIVVINTSEQRSLINPNRLQKVLLGNAFVYWYNSLEVHEELTYLWGKNISLCVTKDTIRIYRQQLNIQNINESKIHRFFLFRDYYSKPDELIQIIVKSLFRGITSSFVGKRVTDIDSIYELYRLQRLDELRTASKAIADISIEERQYLSALEEDNSELSKKNIQLIDELESSKKEYDNMQLDFEIAQEKLKTMEKEFQAVSLSQAHMSSVITNIHDLRSLLDELPKNNEEILKLIADLYKDRIIVLEEAFTSSKQADFTDLYSSWKLLKSMADILPKLHFETESINVEQEFKNLSGGFQLTLKESSQTKADSQLMKLRKRNYDGMEIDISAHTKLDKSQKHLRIHYYPDPIKKLIVIGHFGNHLKTAGSGRRKEK